MNFVVTLSSYIQSSSIPFLQPRPHHYDLSWFLHQYRWWSCWPTNKTNFGKGFNVQTITKWTAAPSAGRVRSEVRNDWAHCDYTSWTEVKYNTCFDCMETLVVHLGLASEDEKELLGQLQLWRKHGKMLLYISEEIFLSHLLKLRRSYQNCI